MAEASHRILIVDDNEDNRYLLNRRLRRAGYDAVESAESGPEALDKLRAETFDLVLLDIMMPEMDGIEVLDRINRDTSLRNVPVIMVSVLDDPERVVQCTEMGASDYVSETTSSETLVASVRKCLAWTGPAEQPDPGGSRDDR